MYLYLLHNKQQNQHFDIYWDAGHDNLSKFYINHHTAQDHKDIRKAHVQDKLNCIPSQYMNCMLTKTLQGCIGKIPSVQHTMTQ